MSARAVPALIVLCLLAVAVGCGGDGDGSETTSTRAVDRESFKEAVTSALKVAGFDADQGIGAEVRVYSGPNYVDIDLDEALVRVKDDPSSHDEVVAEIVEQAGPLLEEGISGESLDDVEADVMPLLKGLFELRTYPDEPAQTPFAGDLVVLYAVHDDDRFRFVTAADVERWGTSLEDLHELAVANLERQTEEEQPLLCEPAGDSQLCGWSSGDGYDATRMIVPALRRQIEREYGGPSVYAVPIETVFVALPVDVFTGQNEELFRQKVQQDFLASDDPLSPLVFTEEDGEIVVSERG